MNGFPLKDVAQLVGKSPGTIRRWCEQGKFPRIARKTRGGYWRFRRLPTRAELGDLMARRRGASPGGVYVRRPAISPLSFDFQAGADGSSALRRMIPRGGRRFPVDFGAAVLLLAVRIRQRLDAGSGGNRISLSPVHYELAQSIVGEVCLRRSRGGEGYHNLFRLGAAELFESGAKVNVASVARWMGCSRTSLYAKMGKTELKEILERMAGPYARENRARHNGRPMIVVPEF